MEEYGTSSEETSINKFDIELNASARGFLKEAVKWANFLSILGYVMLGFIVLLAVFSGSFFAAMSSYSPGMQSVRSFEGSFITIIYFLIGALYFFPIYYLNRFAFNAKKALADKNPETLATSFEYLKSHYKYMGITAIVFLCFYGLLILGLIIAVLTVGLNL